MNCLYSFRTENKLELHKNVCENNFFCNVFMRSEDTTKILQFNQKIGKLCKHIPSCYSMSTILSFKSMKNKHDVHRGKDCMKKFCEFLRERVRKISNFKKKK